MAFSKGSMKASLLILAAAEAWQTNAFTPVVRLLRPQQQCQHPPQRTPHQQHSYSSSATMTTALFNSRRDFLSQSSAFLSTVLTVPLANANDEEEETTTAVLLVQQEQELLKDVMKEEAEEEKATKDTKALISELEEQIKAEEEAEAEAEAVATTTDTSTSSTDTITTDPTDSSTDNGGNNSEQDDGDAIAVPDAKDEEIAQTTKTLIDNLEKEEEKILSETESLITEIESLESTIEESNSNNSNNNINNNNNNNNNMDTNNDNQDSTTATATTEAATATETATTTEATSIEAETKEFVNKLKTRVVEKEDLITRLKHESERDIDPKTGHFKVMSKKEFLNRKPSDLEFLETLKENALNEEEFERDLDAFEGLLENKLRSIVKEVNKDIREFSKSAGPLAEEIERDFLAPVLERGVEEVKKSAMPLAEDVLKKGDEALENILNPPFKIF